MSTLRILLLAFLLLPQANTCLWVDGTTMDGAHRRIEGHFPASQLRNTLDESPEDKIEHIRFRKNGQQDAFSQNEIEGVSEVLKGNHERAIRIFVQAEIDHPGRYSTAVNLGTAYELKGELELALKWISEGIRRNPKSHLGTEWLHVEILKARQKLKEDPSYLHQHHVVELPESYTAKSSVLIGDHRYTVEQIADSIHYQLQERMIFVKPLDPIVADLLFTFGQIEGRTNVVESGIKLFELANAYGFANQDLIRTEIERYEQAIPYGKIKRTTYIVLGIAAFVLLLFFAWRKKWFFLSRRAYLKHRNEKQMRSDF